jgi:hypothetical protein
VPVGGKVTGQSPSLSGLNMTYLEVFWKAPKSLVIDYREGIIAQVSNSWSLNKTDHGEYIVDIQVLPLSSSNNSP